MAFRYINPGYGDLFVRRSQQTYDTDTSSTYTKTGVAFCKCGTVELPTPPSGTKELWGKFDLYNTTSYDYGYLDFRSQNNRCGIGKNHNSYTGDIYHFTNDNRTSILTFTSNGILSLYFHIKADSTNGILDVYKEGVNIYSFTGNVLDGEEITAIKFYSNSGGKSFSNIIIADTEVGMSEQIITLPISATDATMTDNGNGTFTAENAGEYVKQTIDAATLKQTYEADKTTITGLMIAGEPAYYDGEGLYHIECLQGNTAISESALDTNNVTSVMQGLNLQSSIDNLAANTYGWRVTS